MFISSTEQPKTIRNTNTVVSEMDYSVNHQVEQQKTKISAYLQSRIKPIIQHYNQTEKYQKSYENITFLTSNLRNQDGLISQKMQELFGTTSSSQMTQNNLNAFTNVNIASKMQSSVQVEECETPIVVQPRVN